ncbi:MAG TPA: hypothetical protein EYH00_02340 [Archaeoglobus profundus]|nr:hypothetical protein [Archaeoglobus profundus]
MVELDQSSIDQLVAAAEEDTIEGKISKLEKDVEVIKGSIKKLLMDIRETLNSLENPFQSLQNLAEVLESTSSSKPQTIQVIPVEPKEEKEEKREEKKEENQEIQQEQIMEEKEKEEKKEKKVQKEKERVELKIIPKEVKMDLLTMYYVMRWAKSMLAKYDVYMIKGILELLESANYITSDIKELISKIVDLVIAVENLEDLVVDIYDLLHRLAKGESVRIDTTNIDSEIIKILLDSRKARGAIKNE